MRSTRAGHSGDETIDDDPTILWCRIPGWSFRVGLQPVLLVGALFMAAVLLWLVPGVDRVYPVLMLAFLVYVVLLFLGIGLWSRKAALAPFAGIERGALHPIERILVDQERETPRFGARIEDLWSWEELTERCHREGVVMPRTILAQTLKPRLMPLERPAEFLEPEPIHPSSNVGYAATLFLVLIYLWNAAAQFFMGHYMVTAIWLVCGLFFALGIPTLRDRVRKLWDSGGRFVAGQGWLRDRRGRIWTTSDSVVVVRKSFTTSTLAWWVIGPAGVSWITFINENDPEFIKLWQRWNHPDPRPELAYQTDS